MPDWYSPKWFSRIGLALVWFGLKLHLLEMIPKYVDLSFTKIMLFCILNLLHKSVHFLSVKRAVKWLKGNGVRSLKTPAFIVCGSFGKAQWSYVAISYLIGSHVCKTFFLWFFFIRRRKRRPPNQIVSQKRSRRNKRLQNMQACGNALNETLRLKAPRLVLPWVLCPSFRQ